MSETDKAAAPAGYCRVSPFRYSARLAVEARTRKNREVRDREHRAPPPTRFRASASNAPPSADVRQEQIPG